MFGRDIAPFNLLSYFNLIGGRQAENESKREGGKEREEGKRRLWRRL